MGDLSNKLIRQTFDGLIKTNDEDPISATPKRLQDGVGNDLPVEVGLGGMTYYGTQDFTNATVTGIGGGGGGGLTNYQGYPFDVPVYGYGATYARTSQYINSEVYWQAAIDQNPNTIIFGKLFLDPTLTVTELITPFLSVVDNDTYTIGIYDCHPKGGPKDLVFTTTINVVGASGDQYVSTPISFSPTENRYWFALQTPSNGASKVGMFNRNAFQNNYFTYGAWGSSPVGLLAINSLYDNQTPMPASYADTYQFGHRDEGAVILYRTN